MDITERDTTLKARYTYTPMSYNNVPIRYRSRYENDFNQKPTCNFCKQGKPLEEYYWIEVNANIYQIIYHIPFCDENCSNLYILDHF